MKRQMTSLLTVENVINMTAMQTHMEHEKAMYRGQCGVPWSSIIVCIVYLRLLGTPTDWAFHVLVIRTNEIR